MTEGLLKCGEEAVSKLQFLLTQKHIDSNMHMEDRGDIQSSVKRNAFQMVAEYDVSFRNMVQL